jgi:hypothetical protein
MNNRARMRISNQMVKDYLLEMGYDQIWFKPHTARNDIVYTQNGKYYATDLWNLFDGMCWGRDQLFFLQMKTNKWADRKPIDQFLKTHNAIVFVFNVTDKLKECNGKYKVFVRRYPEC